jgi:hypothetical protein
MKILSIVFTVCFSVIITLSFTRKESNNRHINRQLLSVEGFNPEADKDQIQPSSANPFYWQYKGKPIMLLGGTWQDNLFNHPAGLAGHLDLLVSVGGNYVRNTMSHRNKGNLFAFERNEGGLFNLDSFNDEYWQRFQNFLDLCYHRDIIVQIEIWDPWDHYENHQSFGGWSYHPFNPANNINYTPVESGLPSEINYAPRGEPTDHKFFRTVPALDNNELVLKYQTAFVDKMLSVSLHYPNVLYCMNNESGERIEWSDYWADYLRAQAGKAGIRINIAEMRRNEDVRAKDHNIIYDNPRRYTFLDISQNNAWYGLGQGHYDNIMYVREYIAGQPRPVNNIKNYGAARHGEEESVARYCRIVFAGCASARFHRPHPLEEPEAHESATDTGLGLSPRAQAIIRSMRLVTDELDLITCEPKNDLLFDREENEAYLLTDAGKRYAIYFPQNAGDGTVMLDLADKEGKYQLRWLPVSKGKWLEENRLLQGGEKVRITKPAEGHWVALIK